MQAFSSANPHSHSPAPVSTSSTRTIQFVQGTQDDVEELLSSELELSFASAMSLNSPLRASTKLVDNVGREDVIPMDISPEPSRFTQHSRITGGRLVEKVMRTHGTTNFVRLFGRDLSNEAPIPLAVSSCDSTAAIPDSVCLVSVESRPPFIISRLIPLYCSLIISPRRLMRWISTVPSRKVSSFLQRRTNCLRHLSLQLKEPQTSKPCSMTRPLQSPAGMTPQSIPLRSGDQLRLSPPKKQLKVVVVLELSVSSMAHRLLLIPPRAYSSWNA